MDGMQKTGEGEGEHITKKAVQQKLPAATGTKVRVQMVEKWLVPGAQLKRGRTEGELC